MQVNEDIKFHLDLLHSGLQAWQISRKRTAYPIPKLPCAPVELVRAHLPSLMSLLMDAQVAQVCELMRLQRTDIQVQFGAAGLAGEPTDDVERAGFGDAAAHSHYKLKEKEKGQKLTQKRPGEKPSHLAKGEMTPKEAEKGDKQTQKEKQTQIEKKQTASNALQESLTTSLSKQLVASFLLFSEILQVQEQLMVAASVAQSQSDGGSSGIGIGMGGASTGSQSQQTQRDVEIRAHIELLMTLMKQVPSACLLDLTSATPATAGAGSGALGAPAGLGASADAALPACATEGAPKDPTDRADLKPTTPTTPTGLVTF